MLNGVAMVCGVFVIRQFVLARRGVKGFLFSEIILLPLSWIALFTVTEENSSSWGFIILLAALSPFFGYFWYRKQGKVRKRILKTLTFPFLWIFFFILSRAFLGEEFILLSAIVSLFLAAIPLISLRELIKKSAEKNRKRTARVREDQSSEEETRQKQKFLDQVIQELKE